MVLRLNPKAVSLCSGVPPGAVASRIGHGSQFLQILVTELGFLDRAKILTVLLISVSFAGPPGICGGVFYPKQMPWGPKVALTLFPDRCSLVHFTYLTSTAPKETRSHAPVGSNRHPEFVTTTPNAYLTMHYSIWHKVLE